MTLCVCVCVRQRGDGLVKRDVFRYISVREHLGVEDVRGLRIVW